MPVVVLERNLVSATACVLINKRKFAHLSSFSIDGVDTLESCGPEGGTGQVVGERVDLRLVELLSQGQTVVVERLQRKFSDEDGEIVRLDSGGLTTGDLGNIVGVNSSGSEEVQVLRGRATRVKNANTQQNLVATLTESNATFCPLLQKGAQYFAPMNASLIMIHKLGFRFCILA